MLSWITEKQDVWQRLQSCNKPVVVYGMGDGAVKILQVMQRYGIRPAAMFASDDFARGNSFMGYTVGKLRDVQALYDDFIIVLAFAVRDLPTIERIRALSQQYELVAPDVPVAGVELFNMEFVRRHEQDFLQGCRQVITRDRPKILIAAYHRSEDLFALPQQIAAIRPDYRFYLRHYRYIPAWDVNLYCV